VTVIGYIGLACIVLGALFWWAVVAVGSHEPPEVKR